VPFSQDLAYQAISAEKFNSYSAWFLGTMSALLAMFLIYIQTSAPAESRNTQKASSLTASESQNPSKPKLAAEKPIAPVADSNFNMESTWKVAICQWESRITQNASSPKPKSSRKRKERRRKVATFPHTKSQLKKSKPNKEAIFGKTKVFSL
jgi:hypothetical protein